MSDEPTIRIRDGSLVTRYEYDMMEKQAQKAKANRQVKFDSSLDYTDLVAELRSGEDGLEYASADAIEALMARIAELEAALLPFAAIADESTANLADNYMYSDCYPMSAFRAAKAALGEKE